MLFGAKVAMRLKTHKTKQQIKKVAVSPLFSISLLLLPQRACCSKKSLDKSVFVLVRNEKELSHILKHAKMYFGRSNSFSAVIFFFFFTRVHIFLHCFNWLAVSNRKWYRENYFFLKKISLIDFE